MIANDAATEIGTLRGQTNEANFRIAAKFTALEVAMGELKKNRLQLQVPTEPTKAAELERPRFIDPVTGKCEWADSGQAAASHPARKGFGPSSQQEQDDGLHGWYMGSPSKSACPMRQPPGYERPQEQYQQSPQAPQRQSPGTINITP